MHLPRRLRTSWGVILVLTLLLPPGEVEAKKRRSKRAPSQGLEIELTPDRLTASGRRVVKLRDGLVAYSAVGKGGVITPFRKWLARRRLRSGTPVSLRLSEDGPIDTLLAVTRTLQSAGLSSFSIDVGGTKLPVERPRTCTEKNTDAPQTVSILSVGVYSDRWSVHESAGALGPSGCILDLESLATPQIVNVQSVSIGDGAEERLKELVEESVSGGPVVLVLTTSKRAATADLLRAGTVLYGVGQNQPDGTVLGPLRFLELQRRPGQNSPAVASKQPALIVFGGSAPASIGEEVSLEIQVDKLSRALDPARPDVFFGAGKKRLVRVMKDIPLDGAVAALLGPRGWLTQRAAELNPKDVASRENIVRAITEASATPAGTVVFGVGHGSKPNARGDGSIDLAGPKNRLWVSELSRILDETSPRGETALVLGHCYSGSFTSILYRAGGWRPASPMRCAFTAVPPDRPADGCVTNAADRSIKAYAWMMGDAFERGEEADVDGDGRVTLAEAHAYARIHDPTANVPYSSSENWIRERARAKRINGTIGQAKRRATPEDAAVLEALQPPNITPKSRLSSVRGRLKKLSMELGRVARSLNALGKRTETLRVSLLRRLLSERPDLQRTLAAADAEGLRAADRDLALRSDVRKLMTLANQFREESAEVRELHHQTARLERYLRAAEVALLSARMRPQDNAILETIRQCEALTPLP